MTIFAEGIQVKYKNHIGIIEFVCDEYVTVCVKTYGDKFRTVCMLVYPNQWKDIEIVGDYETEEK
jgi:hypothetical protein